MERLTDHFYAWERRGRGWQVWDGPVELEPPFKRCFASALSETRTFVDGGLRPTFLSKLTDRLLGAIQRNSDAIVLEDEPCEEPVPRAWSGHCERSELEIAVPRDLKIGREASEQLLLAFPLSVGPAAFELLGSANAVRLVLSCAATSEASVTQPVKGHFPEALVTRSPDALEKAWSGCGGAETVVVDFGLAREFMVPLRIPKKLEPDPLVGIVAALGDLGGGEAGVFQVLFQRARQPWAGEALRSVLDERGSPFFIDAPEVSAQAKAKVSRPLFACVLRVGVRAVTRGRALEVARRLAAALDLLGDPLGNELMPLEQAIDSDEHERDLLSRRSRRSGMLLNIEELASLVHLPTSAVRDPRLLRHGRKTRPAPAAVGKGASLGRNTHDGHATEVRLSPEQRSRHMYVIGASGTGKSTLLLNLIRQDLEAGEGLAVFDPHGDLVDRILGLVPQSRVDDVVLVDPGDAEFPIGFNVLSAKSDLEQTLLASDLVSLFQRLSMSWGDQMTSVLGNAILAFLENDRGGSIVDLRRFLVEPAFRKEILKGVRDRDVAYFWEREFPLLRGRPQAPILTRLDTFLRPKPIRYMVAQKDGRLDLRHVMDQGKVLLCRLSHGAIGEENAYLLGTLLVSKLHQVAMSRQGMAEKDRRPFYLYIDEFHHFVTPSMAAILSGARKYRLGLVLAHQDLRQLQSRSADVYAAVISNPCTRVCFRVGDEDARVLAKGFSAFDADDLQNLSTGQAIARIERADCDFNLETQPLPPVDDSIAEERRRQVVERTRQAYGRPRQEIEALLWPTQIRPELSDEDPTNDVERRTAPTRVTGPAVGQGSGSLARTSALPVRSDQNRTDAPSGGRGGPEHTYVQGLIRRWADANDWRATLEEPVLDGMGRVDVALRRGDTSVACEIAVSSPAEHEFQNIQKCLVAGFSVVLSVCGDKRRLGHIRTLAKDRLSAEQLKQIHFVSPEQALQVLAVLAEQAYSADTTVRGYKVRVRFKAGKVGEQEQRRGAVSSVIAKAIRRLGRKP